MWDLDDRSCCPSVFSSHRFLILHSCFLFIFCFLGTTAAMEAMIERTEPTTEEDEEEEEEWTMASGGL